MARRQNELSGTTQRASSRVVLIGPPGAGKGTQANMIAGKLGIPHVSTGDLFRRNVDDNTPLGHQAKSYMDSGELVPDELTVAMIADRLAEADAADGFLLDGFPRNLRQAEQLAVTLRQSGHAVDSVVEMRLDRDEVVRRLAGRRVCSDCHRSWHIEFEPPRVPGICDGCAGELHQRHDDHEKSIRRRLELYDEQTAPVVAFYHAQRVLIPVDAGGSVESVSERMIAALAG